MTHHRLVTVWRREPRVWEWACACGHNKTAPSVDEALDAANTHQAINNLPSEEGCDGC